MVPIKMWAKEAEVEELAMAQIQNIAALPWAWHHVAIMPDCHFGKGATVGSVIAMKDAIAPAAVGVDIGCGMSAMPTSLGADDLPESLTALRSDVEAAIPLGMSSHVEPQWEKVVGASDLWEEFGGLDPHVERLLPRAMAQIGTLGSGNHFLELCLDEDKRVWIMLHSGSRNIGNELAKIHIARARALTHNHDLPDPELAVFLAETPEMQAYRRDLFWAQRYAAVNRAAMLILYMEVLKKHFPTVRWGQSISCHHNYVSEENHFGEDVLVTRKGAIRARRDEMGIIPGSMGTKSYIVRGLGNPDSFESASHGAGRRMSRGAAKRTFTVKDLEAQTVGVECRKDAGVLDEIPSAYKPIDDVMANQKDLVEIVHELKQVMCVKG